MVVERVWGGKIDPKFDCHYFDPTCAAGGALSDTPTTSHMWSTTTQASRDRDNKKLHQGDNSYRAALMLVILELAQVKDEKSGDAQ